MLELNAPEGTVGRLCIFDERIQRLRRQGRYAVEARWAEVTLEALNAYHMAKKLAKDPRYAELVAHVDTIRRHLARTNAPKGKKQTTDREAETQGG
ncbi:MAG TPA: hypothetical protein VF432_10675 [Thermoanaerobaculia bacterium]